MPPFLVPSPALLDYSSPVGTSPEELRLVRQAAVAAANIVEGANNGNFELLLTSALRAQIGDAWHWNPPSPADLLGTILGYVTSFISRGFAVRYVDVGGVTGHQPHPLPIGSEKRGRAPEWADQAGRILLLHDQCRKPTDSFFIGVTCCSAFCGGAVGNYAGPQSPSLPMIGPKELPSLVDAYELRTDDVDLRQTVSMDSFIRHIGRLFHGEIKKGKGNHRNVVFSNGARWPFSGNWSHFSDSILKQLEDELPVPFEYIKYTLLTGASPARKHVRLAAVARVD